MKTIIPHTENIHKKLRLYIGDQVACDYIKRNRLARDWAIVHAATYPCYNMYIRHKPVRTSTIHIDNHIYLDIVDSGHIRERDQEVIQYALKFIHYFVTENVKAEKKGDKQLNILIHCNKGRSRAPTIALFYLGAIGIFNKIPRVLDTEDYKQALGAFKYFFYRRYQPSDLMIATVRELWDVIRINKLEFF